MPLFSFLRLRCRYALFFIISLLLLDYAAFCYASATMLACSSYHTATLITMFVAFAMRAITRGMIITSPSIGTVTRAYFAFQLYAITPLFSLSYAMPYAFAFHLFYFLSLSFAAEAPCFITHSTSTTYTGHRAMPILFSIIFRHYAAIFRRAIEFYLIFRFRYFSR